MQEIQDGHNGYHSEAEPEQVASLLIFHSLIV